MQEPEQSGAESASEKDRRTGNIVLLLFLVILIGCGIWLINAMIEQRAIDNCLAQGRRNCAPVEVPAR